MKTPSLSKHFRKLTQLICFPLLVFLCNVLPHSTYCSAQGNQEIERDKGDFYYNGGQRIPLIRHKDLLSVKLKEKGPESSGGTLSLNAVLKRNKGLKLSEASKLFVRHKLHLLEHCDGGNGAKHDGVISCLRDDSDVEYVQPVFVTGLDKPLVMSDCFVAKFEGNLTRKEIDEINARHAVEIAKSIEVDSNVYVLRVTGLKNRTTLDVANKYYQMDEIEWSHPNWIRRLELRHLPDDQLFPVQWHLNNTSVGGTTDADIDAPEAWDITEGDDEIIIAIIDTGVDIVHEDFAEKVLPGRDVINDDDDPKPQNGEDHGTAVAGLAVANQDNGIGVSGVAPDCGLMPIRLLVEGMTVSDEAEAFFFAAQNGADIISNSWGPFDCTGNEFPLPDVTKAAIDFAADEGRDGKGCIIFFAAGNCDESIDNDGYASYDKVIAVGASTDKDEKAFYSDHGLSLDILAPSSGGLRRITTTDRMEGKGYSSGNYTSSFGGTSAAAPIAAGVAALMLSVNDSLSRSDVQEILQYTADKINPADANYDANGFSHRYGYGRVNAFRAVVEAINPNFPPTVSIQSPNEDIIIRESETVKFAGNAIDKENAIVSYHWDFADGAPDAFVKDPGEVTFNTAGVFHATFTVTDNGGNQSSSSVTIMVLEPEEDVVNYSVNNTNKSTKIPDNQPDGIVSSDVFADTGSYVVEVNVSVDITHTYIGDLVVLIESPEGTRVTLHNRSGGSSANLITTYDTSAVPAESLDAFVGENPRGTWTLHVSDSAPLDEGTLNTWQLDIITIDDSGLRRPDLVVRKMRVKRTKWNRRVKVKSVIKNRGKVESSPFEIRYLLSSDKILDTNDIILKTVEYNTLRSLKKSRRRTRLRIPTSVSRGRYYLIMEIDPSDLIREVDEANNIRILRRTIRIR